MLDRLRLTGRPVSVQTALGSGNWHGPVTSACRCMARRSALPLDRAEQRGHLVGMLIYKIFRSEEWAALCRDGATAGAPIDRADGYVHFSTGEQVAETAAKYFADAEGLVLLACDSEAMAAELKWEPSRGGALFPHLYRDLTMDDIVWQTDLPIEGGQHQFPPGVTGE